MELRLGPLRPQAPGQPLEKDIQKRIARGQQRIEEGASRRSEALHFWRGDQYVFVNSENNLTYQSTVSNLDGTGKPAHRVRQARNLIAPVVEGKVSGATRNIPSYEITPTTTDPEDISASRLSEKVALFGYDEWRIRRASKKVVTLAIVAEEGFAWPYFDTTIGPFADDGAGGVVGQGEIRIRTYPRNAVGWEPGVDFEDSRWLFVAQARAKEEVEAQEGFLGGKLTADAAADQSRDALGSRPKHTDLVMETHYLERPSAARPRGRWLVIANDRVICAERDYPCADHEGKIIDEPVLHRLSYTVDPDNDEDMGLVRHLVPIQRSYNDCNNKLLEAKNLALNAQALGPPNFLRTPLTDEPGAYFSVNGDPDLIKWREPPPPALFAHLSQLKEEAKDDINMIAGTEDLPARVESSTAIQAVIERQEGRWQAFIGDLAEFHSRLMRHCLYLVQRYYDEQRIVKIRGRTGWEIIPDFVGAQLLGQVDVRVLPGSLEPKTRSAIQAQVLAYADRGWVSPEAAMAAIDGGTAESLIRRYELDVARANTVIQKIRQNPHALLMEPVMPGESPSWMPRPFDNVAVHLDIVADAMKTPEYEDSPPLVKEALQLYYQGCEYLQAQQAMQAQMAQNAQAEQLGMNNAAKPQSQSQSPGKPPSSVLGPQYFAGSQQPR